MSQKRPARYAKSTGPTIACGQSSPGLPDEGISIVRTSWLTTNMATRRQKGTCRLRMKYGMALNMAPITAA